MCDDNGKKFIATLYNVLLAPDFCNRLFSIITLMNAGHTCIFHKGFCTMYFVAEKDNAVTLLHSAQRKHAFTGKIKDIPKKNKFPARKKIACSTLAVTVQLYATFSKSLQLVRSSLDVMVRLSSNKLRKFGIRL